MQLGSLFSTYGTIAIFSYFFGGLIADKFPPGKLMGIALFTTALGGLVMATFPSFFVLQILYAYWGITTIFLFWGAMIKATRLWGGNKNQGTAFGFLDAGRGIVASSIGIIGVLKSLIFQTIGLFRPTMRQVTRTDTRIVAHKSAALAAQNFMISMAGIGYDTCPMEGSDTLLVKKILKLNRKAEISMVIGCGLRTEKGIYGEQLRVPFNQVYTYI